MFRMPDLINVFARDTCGATVIEYALIAAIVGLGMIVGLFTFGGRLPNAFNAIGELLTTQLS